MSLVLRCTLGAVVFAVLCGGVWLFSGGHISPVIPVILAPVLAFALRNIFIGLGAALFVGCVLLYVPDQPLLGWGKATWEFVFILFQQVNDVYLLQIYLFVVAMLGFIFILTQAGGLEILANRCAKWAKDKRSTQFSTFILGLLLFIDDYANSLLVGATMRPLSDKQRVSREKLSFIVDATAAPVAGVALVSTWIGHELGLFQAVNDELALGQTGYALFLDALGSRYYCWFMLLFVFFVILSRRDWGPMAKAEQKAAIQPPPPLDPEISPTKRISSNSLVPVLLPLSATLVIVLVGIWWDGGGLNKWQGLSSFISITYWREVLGASENNISVLLVAGLVGWFLSVTTARMYMRTSWSDVIRATKAGIKTSLTPVFILLLAYAFKEVCTRLETATFLGELLQHTLSAIWFPFFVFLIAAVVAFSTGTSWGTMSILIPVAAPLAYELDGGIYGLTTIITLGAVLDGAIFGDHCSLISDTTVLSSTSTQCPVMDHVRTQMPYAVLVACVAGIYGYLGASFGLSNVWVLGSGLLTLVGLHYFFSYLWHSWQT